MTREELESMLEFFAAEQDFWRSKYLREHPELDTWEYVETVREKEQGL